ncbi:MAG: spore germination protein GerW family protein [Solirubrobacterales bacterium]
MKVQDVHETISKARDAITVKRVYGAAYERDGVTVIPAAAVGGGGGGGGGEDTEGGSGSGVGFGLGARPVGAYVIENGSVRWAPAFDVTRIAGQALVAAAAIALLLARRRS